MLTPSRTFYAEIALREYASENFLDGTARALRCINFSRPPSVSLVTFIVFNDLLLICKASGSKKLSVVTQYPTSKLTCAALDESATAAHLRNSFELVHDGTQRVFFATSEELRAQALKQLQRAITSGARNSDEGDNVCANIT